MDSLSNSCWNVRNQIICFSISISERSPLLSISNDKKIVSLISLETTILKSRFEWSNLEQQFKTVFSFAIQSHRIF